MEAAKRDMLVYKQMVFELKAVLAMKKDKKVRKALQEEIHANEDIIKMLIQSGVPDIQLPKDIELQITVEKNKKPTQQGSKFPRTRARVAEEEAGNEGGMGENVVQEELAVNDEEEVINRKNHSVERNKQRKNVMESDKVSNRNKPSVETEDLFRLPDFDDNDDEEDKDYQPPPRV